jgi:ABC-type proline/glycine betaine transport system permease subunit
LTKKEKAGFFLLRGNQAKINALIFLIFYCISSILSATGWGLSEVSKAAKAAFYTDNA